VKLPVCKHVLDINAGFGQVVHSPAALRKLDSFNKRELDRYTALAMETRAATIYLTGVLERAETDERFEIVEETGTTPHRATRSS